MNEDELESLVDDLADLLDRYNTRHKVYPNNLYSCAEELMDELQELRDQVDKIRSLV